MSGFLDEWGFPLMVFVAVELLFGALVAGAGYELHMKDKRDQRCAEQCGGSYLMLEDGCMCTNGVEAPRD